MSVPVTARRTRSGDETSSLMFDGRLLVGGRQKAQERRVPGLGFCSVRSRGVHHCLVEPSSTRKKALNVLQGRPPKRSTLKCVVRRRPSLPHGPPCSTIGAEKLNFRVRNGAGCFPLAMITETLWRCGSWMDSITRVDVPDRISGTAQWTRTRIESFDVYQVVGLLVPVSYMHCCTSTSGLSTR